MKCQQCQSEIEPGEEKGHRDQTLCEDCYLVDLSRVRVCDPWAVYCATSAERRGEPVTLTPIQIEILQILQKTGGLEPSELLRKLGGKLTLPQFEREFAALRHLEKARGEKREGKVFVRPW